MPNKSDDTNISDVLALQRVFHRLKFCDKPVGTNKLAKSFGWKTPLSYNVQEFLKIVCIMFLI